MSDFDVFPFHAIIIYESKPEMTVGEGSNIEFVFPTFSHKYIGVWRCYICSRGSAIYLLLNVSISRVNLFNWTRVGSYTMHS